MEMNGTSKQLSTLTKRERCFMGLADKICIITGGGDGIGKGTAIMMAGEGAKLVLVGRTASKVEAVKKEIEDNGGTADAFGMNVADFDAVRRMTKAVLDGHGRIDVLINCAGHSSPHRKLLTTTPEEIHGVIDSNLVGTIFCTQAVIPSMVEAKTGTIINISSMAGVQPGLMGGMIYSAAKAAVINFTEFISGEFKNTGVRASVVIPGEVDTPILDNRPVPPSAEARMTMVTVDDAAEAITLIARLDGRTNIPTLIIKPTFQRDSSKEVGTA